MKRILSSLISFILVFTVVFSVAACNKSDSGETSGNAASADASGNASGGASGNASGGAGGSGNIVIVDPTEYDYGGGSKHDENYYKVEVPEYQKTDDLLIGNGATEYQIVVASDATATVYNAANELNTLIFEATGAVFGIKTDEEVVWSDNAKFISLGDTSIATAAGSANDMFSTAA